MITSTRSARTEAEDVKEREAIDFNSARGSIVVAETTMIDITRAVVDFSTPRR